MKKRRIRRKIAGFRLREMLAMMNPEALAKLPLPVNRSDLRPARKARPR
jgi:hypothetical protein